MKLTNAEKATLNRALGIIETAAAMSDEKMSEKLYDALGMLESVLGHKGVV